MALSFSDRSINDTQIIFSPFSTAWAVLYLLHSVARIWEPGEGDRRLLKGIVMEVDDSVVSRERETKTKCIGKEHLR